MTKKQLSNQIQEQQNTLRRVRTEELLKKTRESNQKTDTNSEFNDILQNIYSDDYTSISSGVYGLRMYLSQNNNPPIDKVLNLNILPVLNKLLVFENFKTQDNSVIKTIMVETAWCLTNICTGTHEQTKCVIDAGVSANLVKFLTYDDDDLVDQAVWCLGNIAGDCEEFRDILLNLNVLSLVVNNLKKYEFNNAKLKIFRNLMWLAGNLLRGRSPPASLETQKTLFEVFSNYCCIDDAQVINSIFWGLSYICDSNDSLTKQFLNSNIFEELKILMKNYLLKANSSKNSYNNKKAEICENSMSPIIRLLGNIVAGDNEQTEFVIQSGLLNNLNTIFYKCKNVRASRLRKEICWLLSNVTAGVDQHVQFVIDRNYCVLLIDAIANYEMFIRKEAAYALHNITCAPNSLKVVYSLLDMNVCIAIKKCLNAANNNTDVVCLLLDICVNLLESGVEIKKNTNNNVVMDKFISSKLADAIEDCQDFRSDKIAEKAYNIIMTYFDAEDDENYY